MASNNLHGTQMVDTLRMEQEEHDDRMFKPVELKVDNEKFFSKKSLILAAAVGGLSFLLNLHIFDEYMSKFVNNMNLLNVIKSLTLIAVILIASKLI